MRRPVVGEQEDMPHVQSKHPQKSRSGGKFHVCLVVVKVEQHRSAPVFVYEIELR